MTDEYNSKIASIIGAADGGPGGDDPKKAKKAAKPAAATGPVVVEGGKLDTDTGLSVKNPAALADNVPNYSPTKDPDVFIGRNGATITKQQFEQNQKGQMPFNSFHDYANWVGGWAKDPKEMPVFHKYYRTYPEGQINGVDIFKLYQQNDPTINAILNRNIAKPGEVPMFGADDSDALRMLIAKQNAINNYLYGSSNTQQAGAPAPTP